MAQFLNDDPGGFLTYDVGPFDAAGWKLHADGSRVHRWGCTFHDGEGCDGHCSPRPAPPDQNRSMGTAH